MKDLFGSIIEVATMVVKVPVSILKALCEAILGKI